MLIVNTFSSNNYATIQHTKNDFCVQTSLLRSEGEEVTFQACPLAGGDRNAVWDVIKL
jgi:hypothetical protein